MKWAIALLIPIVFVVLVSGCIQDVEFGVDEPKTPSDNLTDNKTDDRIKPPEVIYGIITENRTIDEIIEEIKDIEENVSVIEETYKNISKSQDECISGEGGEWTSKTFDELPEFHSINATIQTDIYLSQQAYQSVWVEGWKDNLDALVLSVEDGVLQIGSDPCIKFHNKEPVFNISMKVKIKELTSSHVVDYISIPWGEGSKRYRTIHSDTLKLNKLGGGHMWLDAHASQIDIKFIGGGTIFLTGGHTINKLNLEAHDGVIDTTHITVKDLVAYIYSGIHKVKVSDTMFINITAGIVEYLGDPEITCLKEGGLVYPLGDPGIHNLCYFYFKGDFAVPMGGISCSNNLISMKIVSGRDSLSSANFIIAQIDGISVINRTENVVLGRYKEGFLIKDYNCGSNCSEGLHMIDIGTGHTKVENLTVYCK